MESSNFAQDFTAYMEAGMMATTVYLTVTSGYLISVYIAGSKLSRYQLLTLSILFTIFALMFAFGSYSFFDLGMSLVAVNPGRNYAATQYMPIAVFYVQLIGIAAAIIFTAKVRKNGQ